MTTTIDNPPRNGAQKKPYGLWPWIFLGLWIIWLGALIVMSIPEWSKSKKDLLETNGQQTVPQTTMHP